MLDLGQLDQGAVNDVIARWRYCDSDEFEEWQLQPRTLRCSPRGRTIRFTLRGLSPPTWEMNPSK